MRGTGDWELRWEILTTPRLSQDLETLADHARIVNFNASCLKLLVLRDMASFSI